MIDRTSKSPTLIERVPPHNLEAEMAVLGSALLDGEVVGQLASLLSPGDFYRTAHGRIFEAMHAVYDRGEPVTPILVMEKLRADGLLDRVGGIEYLNQLLGVIESPAHAEYYGSIVREKAMARALIHTTSELQQLAYQEGATGVELLEMAEAQIYELSNKREIGEAEDVRSLINATFEELEQGGADIKGVRTGFTRFDELTGGLKPGELVIVAGRPAMGKTTFALNVARLAATTSNKCVAVFSLEMTAKNIVRNMLCAEAHVEGKKMQSGRFLSELDHVRLREAASALIKTQIFVDDTPGLTPTLLRAKARRLKSRYDLDMIVIDYLQLMSAGTKGSRQENRQQEISFISRSLKLLARELEVPVVALSQLNRAAEQREGNRPRLSDLRESGAIEQDADVICLLYRPEYYLSPRADDAKRAELAGRADVIIGKQRNGPTGTVKLNFIKECMRFDNPLDSAIP